jgi:5-methylcytosine-specific restriction endonuclease McrA
MRRSNLDTVSRDELYKLYTIENKTTREIAEMFSVGDETVRRKLIKYNIGAKPAKRRLKTVSKNLLYKLYIVDKKTRKEILNILNISSTTFYRLLRQYNIKTRNSKPQPKIVLLEKGSRKIEEYKNWRKKCLVRDNFTCQVCGKKGGKLNVHHINNFSEFKELRYKPSNGITLCKECHTKFHSIYGVRNNTKGQLEEFINFVKYGVKNGKD